MSERWVTTADGGTIDREHDVQLRLMQALTAVLDDGGDTHELLAQLAGYSRAHFLSEELLMRLSAYPDYQDHVLDHERLIERLDALGAAGGGRESLRQGVGELIAVLRRHIDSRDRRLHEFLDRQPLGTGGESQR